MATVNFSVPDDVKEAFNVTFSGQNKSAIIAELMGKAVERAQHKQRCHDATTRVLERRQKTPILTEEEIRVVREAGRP